MQEVYFEFPRMNDRELLERFSKLKVRFDFQNSSVAASIGISFSPIPDDIRLGEPTGVLGRILDENGFLVHAASLSIDNLSVAYTRGGRESSPFFDGIRIYYNGNGGPSVDTRLAILASVKRDFETFDRNRAIVLPLPESEKLAALHQEKLDRLEDLNANLIQTTTENFARLEQDFRNRKYANDEELTLHKAELEVEYKRRHDLLAEEQGTLEEKKKELDDRSNTHARRQLRDKMLEDVRVRIASFGVSEATAQKRRPVQYSMVFLCVILAFLAMLTGLELFEQQQLYRVNSTQLMKTIDSANSFSEASVKTMDLEIKKLSVNLESDRTLLYMLWIRMTILGIGLVAAFLYYIRWQNRWAEQHSTSEFQLQQFYLDVNRSNWAIETGLEWKKETQSDIPNAILESITRNLFRVQDELAPALHPADELASALLGSASKLKLKNGENEMEFDNPRKIPREMKGKSGND